MDFRKLADKAKDTIDKRGGMDALKADAEELKKVAQGKGSLTDKAKAAAQAVKEPGAHRPAKKHAPADRAAAGENHPAQHAGNPAATLRKGGPPH